MQQVIQVHMSKASPHGFRVGSMDGLEGAELLAHRTGEFSALRSGDKEVGVFASQTLFVKSFTDKGWYLITILEDENKLREFWFGKEVEK